MCYPHVVCGLAQVAGYQNKLKDEYPDPNAPPDDDVDFRVWLQGAAANTRATKKRLWVRAPARSQEFSPVISGRQVDLSMGWVSKNPLMTIMTRLNHWEMCFVAEGKLG